MCIFRIIKTDSNERKLLCASESGVFLAIKFQSFQKKFPFSSEANEYQSQIIFQKSKNLDSISKKKKNSENLPGQAKSVSHGWTFCAQIFPHLGSLARISVIKLLSQQVSSLHPDYMFGNRIKEKGINGRWISDHGTKVYMCRGI